MVGCEAFDGSGRVDLVGFGERARNRALGKGSEQGRFARFAGGKCIGRAARIVSKIVLRRR